MGEYVVGVDIGASKSHMAVFDLAGNRTGMNEWGPLNHEVLPGSFAQFEQEMQEFTSQTLDKLGIKIEEIVYATFGVAGVDTEAQYEIIHKVYEKIGFQKFTLCNDAYLGVMAGTVEGTGICAINGTGSTVVGIDPAGRMLQLRGVHYISNDRGGGSYLGKQVVGQVYEYLYCGGRKTILKDRLFELLDISSKEEYVKRITELEIQGVDVPAKANRLVSPAAAIGDEVARSILLDMAAYYANSILGVARELDFGDNLNVVLAGSVFVKGRDDLLLLTIEETVTGQLPDKQVDIVLLQTPPVCGAIIWSLKMLGCARLFFDKVKDQF